ncbi:MAG: DUF3575 domain-containing protein [Rikenellaceae bacterium]|nr:DUF3575 domain-containing protein [Rikenellaceae bacterium]
MRLHFVQNGFVVDTAFANNGQTLRELKAVLDSPREIVGVTVSGSASPEGSERINNLISARRAAALSAWFDGAKVVSVDTIGINWAMFRELVERSDVEWRDEALDILACVPGRSVADSVKLRLRMLRRGEAWKYMLEELFPELRFADCTITTEADTPAGTEAVGGQPGCAEEASGKGVADMTVCTEASGRTAEAVTPAEACAGEPAVTAVDRPGVRFAVKTNMLYDVVLIPNLGLEVGFARHYSAAIDWEYAWWSKNASHRFWRVYGGGIELRRWWPTRNSASDRLQLTGHHAGLYYQLLTYDFEFGNRGYQGGRWSHAIGVSYGYSLSLNRRFNIDFTLGIGYLWGEYKRYHAADGCYVWDSTNDLRWFGPTKAGISLVCMIGRQGAGKGGAR